MSSFIISTKHLHLIVAIAVEEKLHIGVALRSPQDLCDLLEDANYASVNERYSENKEPKHIEFTNPDTTGITNIQFNKWVDCLDYQCSDLTDYNKTLAYKVINNMRSSMTMRMQDYAEASWTPDED